MTDIREQSRALIRRGVTELRLAGRPDIVAMAASLVAAQDAARGGILNDVSHHSHPPKSPSPEKIARLLVAHTEFDPDDGDAGLAVPPGVRHPLLCFSPIVQFALLRSRDGRVGGRRAWALPATRAEIENWLAHSIALIEPPATMKDVTEDDRLGALDGDDAAILDRKRFDREVRNARARMVFAMRFGFGLGKIADLLFDLRTSDPVTFVLLMSREFGLALQRCPTLADKERDLPGGERRLPGFKHRRIVALMTVAELQRLVAMLRELLPENGATTSRDLRAVVMAPGQTKIQRGAAIAHEIMNKTGVGRAIGDAPLHAAAMKRVLRLRSLRAAQLDPDAIYRALSEGRIDYDQAVSAQSIVGAHELIATALAPKMMKRAKLGRGHSYPDIVLDSWYGIEGEILVHVALVELGGTIRKGSKARQYCTELANHMLGCITGIRRTVDGDNDRPHKQAVKLVRHYLRRYPKLGSNARFVASAWLDRHRDARLFERLSRPVQLDDPTLKRNSFRWFMALAMHLLFQDFRKLYGAGHRRSIAAKVMADLATGVTVFTRDPLLRAIMTRGVDAGAVRRKAMVDAVAGNNTRIREPAVTSMTAVDRAIDAAQGRVDL